MTAKRESTVSQGIREGNEQSEDYVSRLGVQSRGRLMFDPVIPDEVIEPVLDALDRNGFLHTVTLVEGYFRPVLQTDRERIVGAAAIISYVNSAAAA